MGLGTGDLPHEFTAGGLDLGEQGECEHRHRASLSFKCDELAAKGIDCCRGRGAGLVRLCGPHSHVEHELKQVSERAVLQFSVDLVCCGCLWLFLKKFQHMGRLRLGSGIKSLLEPVPVKKLLEFLVFSWLAQLQGMAHP